MWRIRTAASRRVLWGGGVLLAAMLLVVFAYVPILRALGSFLIIEDRLQPAAAIVVLGGQSPFREMEAARIFCRAMGAESDCDSGGALGRATSALCAGHKSSGKLGNKPGGAHAGGSSGFGDMGRQRRCRVK